MTEKKAEIIKRITPLLDELVTWDVYEHVTKCGYVHSGNVSFCRENPELGIKDLTFAEGAKHRAYYIVEHGLRAINLSAHNHVTFNRGIWRYMQNSAEEAVYDDAGAGMPFQATLCHENAMHDPRRLDTAMLMTGLTMGAPNGLGACFKQVAFQGGFENLDDLPYEDSASYNKLKHLQKAGLFELEYSDIQAIMKQLAVKRDLKTTYFDDTAEEIEPFTTKRLYRRLSGDWEDQNAQFTSGKYFYETPSSIVRWDLVEAYGQGKALRFNQREFAVGELVQELAYMNISDKGGEMSVNMAADHVLLSTTPRIPPFSDAEKEKLATQKPLELSKAMLYYAEVFGFPDTVKDQFSRAALNHVVLGRPADAAELRTYYQDTKMQGGPFRYEQMQGMIQEVAKLKGFTPNFTDVKAPFTAPPFQLDTLVQGGGVPSAVNGNVGDPSGGGTGESPAPKTTPPSKDYRNAAKWAGAAIATGGAVAALNSRKNGEKKSNWRVFAEVASVVAGAALVGWAVWSKSGPANAGISRPRS